MKITLVGFMGSGKTTVAGLLGELLGAEVLEADDLLLARSTRESIREIFDLDGEESFRLLENEVAKSLADVENVVISTGGGMVMREENVPPLKSGGGVVVHLLTSFDVLVDRIPEIDSRPMFKNRQNARELYDKRLPIYEKSADLTVTTDRKTPEEVASAIAKELGTST